MHEHGFPIRTTAILKDEKGITGDTAIGLGTFFKTAAEFWMNLQMTMTCGRNSSAFAGVGG